MKNKKVLITGAKGFIGSNISKYYKSIGFSTYGIGYGDMSIDNCIDNGLEFILNNNKGCKKMSKAARCLVDGNGAKRVASAIKKYVN